jgi:DNA repair exonuclease SbcCD ATPase subunit
MNTIEDLIKKYEEEISDVKLSMENDRKHGDDSFTMEYDTQIKEISRFIEDLKNLPNELRAVNRNEQAKEICPDCGEIMERRYYCPKRGCLYYIP